MNSKGVSPAALDFRDRRYAAHMFVGNNLQDRGDMAGAANEFAIADSIDPSRDEARTVLDALPPTPTPVPPATAKPDARSALKAYFAHLQPDLDSTGESMSSLANASKQVSRSPNLLTDSSWRAQMATSLLQHEDH
jgi:hypothetical protein